jgi:hypothetical protein
MEGTGLRGGGTVIRLKLTRNCVADDQRRAPDAERISKRRKIENDKL